MEAEKTFSKLTGLTLSWRASLAHLQVEQIHKIFKLCGSPPEDYWKRSRLPHATLFRPQQPYDSSLQETFRDLPPSAVDLIETLLSVEPQKRGTASSALASEVKWSTIYSHWILLKEFWVTWDFWMWDPYWCRIVYGNVSVFQNKALCMWSIELACIPS